MAIGERTVLDKKITETVAVIGSNSFSGSHFIDYLLQHTNYNIIGLSRSPEKKAIYLPYKKHNSPRFRFYQFDLNLDLPKLLELIDQEQAAYVVNFASQSIVGASWGNPSHWYKTNVLSTVQLTMALKDKPFLKRYVHVSTPEVYGSCTGMVTENQAFNPSTPYAGSRAAADIFINLLVKQFNFPAVFTRAANVYGPGQQLFKIIPRSIIYSKMGKKIFLDGGGEARRSFIHITDICRATKEIMEQASPGNVYHLSTNQLHSIRELVAIIAKNRGKTLEEISEVAETRRGLDDAYILNSEQAKRDLGWQPEIPLEKGLAETISWIDQNWEIIANEPLEYIHQE